MRVAVRIPVGSRPAHLVPARADYRKWLPRRLFDDAVSPFANPALGVARNGRDVLACCAGGAGGHRDFVVVGNRPRSTVNSDPSESMHGSECETTTSLSGGR